MTRLSRKQEHGPTDLADQVERMRAYTTARLRERLAALRRGDEPADDRVEEAADLAIGTDSDEEIFGHLF